jgi:hypothetical protein
MHLDEEESTAARRSRARLRAILHVWRKDEDDLLSDI